MQNFVSVVNLVGLVWNAICKNFAGTFTVLQEILENHRNRCSLYK